MRPYINRAPEGFQAQYFTQSAPFQNNMSQLSAIPDFYWVVFGWYEPFLAFAGCLGALLFPKQVRSKKTVRDGTGSLIKNADICATGSVASGNGPRRAVS